MREPSRVQREAICHRDGPALLIAGPGSGKTFTLVNRIRNLIEREKIPPEEILVVTFSKAAAKEMQDRFLKESKEYGVHFGTFHSLAYYILKTSFGVNNSSLLSDAEKRNMLSQVLKNNGYSELCNIDFLSGLIGQISKCKNSSEYEQLNIESTNENISKEELDGIIHQFLLFTEEMGKMDFDDMILKSLNKLEKNEDILAEYRNKFKYILVDEFQDINMPQYKLIKLLSCPNNNLFVVGDDDQAIYGFRGSTPGVMKIFQEDFPSCKVLFLTENYRSGRAIVEFAGKVIKNNKNRIRKEFLPKNEIGDIYFRIFEGRKEEEEYLVALLRSLEEDIYDTSVILRTNLEVSIYTNICNRANIPVEGKERKNISAFESFIMDDIMSFLRFIYEGEKRNDFLKFMNKPNKYIQRDSLGENISKDTILRFYKNNDEMVRIIADYFKRIELAKKMKPDLAISIFRKAMGYDRYLKQISRNQTEYLNYLKLAEEIEKMFEVYQRNISVNEYVEDRIKESSATKSEDRIRRGIKIITMHTAKGLEFSNVILPDVNEGIIPAKGCEKDEIEEERRLLYVAITRAKRRLYILATKERNRKVSRFVDGIIPENCEIAMDKQNITCV